MELLFVASQHQILSLLVSFILVVLVHSGFHDRGFDGIDNFGNIGVPFSDFGDGL